MLHNISKVIHLFTSPFPSLPLQLFGLTDANWLPTVQTDGTIEKGCSPAEKKDPAVKHRTSQVTGRCQSEWCSTAAAGSVRSFVFATHRVPLRRAMMYRFVRATLRRASRQLGGGVTSCRYVTMVRMSHSRGCWRRWSWESMLGTMQTTEDVYLSRPGLFLKFWKSHLEGNRINEINRKYTLNLSSRKEWKAFIAKRNNETSILLSTSHIFQPLLEFPVGSPGTLQDIHTDTNQYPHWVEQWESYWV